MSTEIAISARKRNLFCALATTYISEVNCFFNVLFSAHFAGAEATAASRKHQKHATRATHGITYPVPYILANLSRISKLEVASSLRIFGQ